MSDITEFVMAVEEVFAVEIPDEEAEQLHTPGQLADWLSSRLSQRVKPVESAPCLNVYAFNRVRRALSSDAPIRARPRTLLEDLLPSPQRWTERQLVWNQLGAQGLHTPPLEWAPRLKTTLETLWFTAAALSSFPALYVAFEHPLSSSELFRWVSVALGFALYFLILGVITVGVNHLLRPLKIYPPQQTVGELVQRMSEENYWHLATQRGIWPRNAAVGAKPKCGGSCKSSSRASAKWKSKKSRARRTSMNC